jgi:hypothetical protein
VQATLAILDKLDIETDKPTEEEVAKKFGFEESYHSGGLVYKKYHNDGLGYVKECNRCYQYGGLGFTKFNLENVYVRKILNRHPFPT